LQFWYSAVNFWEAAHHFEDGESFSVVGVECRQLTIVELGMVEDNFTIWLDKTAFFVPKETLEIDEALFAVN
jgi:hypothetical protein